MQTYTSTSNGPSTGGGASATDQAKEKTQQAAGQAKEQAQQAAGQAKSALRSQVDQRSTDAGQKVGGVASDARSVAEQLREQGKEQPAKLAEQAADRADRLSRYLTESDGDRILRDVEDFGRRQPWAVIAGGLALGFAASRFLKASSSRRYEQRYDSSRAQLPSRTTYGTPGQGYSGSVGTARGVDTDPITTPGSIGTSAPAPGTAQGSFEEGR